MVSQNFFEALINPYRVFRTNYPLIKTFSEFSAMNSTDNALILFQNHVNTMPSLGECLQASYPGFINASKKVCETTFSDPLEIVFLMKG